MKITVLGCGASHGVPLVGGNWGACDPANPKNRRRRPSVFVEWDGVNILVDTSPDLREQLLDASIERIDAVLYTHVHADHVHGIDDLRAICRRTDKTVGAYGEAAVMEAITRRFSYLFQELGEGNALYQPILTARPFDAPFDVDGRTIVPYPQDHGICPSTGFRFGPFAYSTDVVELDDRAFDALAGIELWIVDCLRLGPEHPTHAHLEKVLGWIERVRPARAVLTHMNHQTDYNEIAAVLPPGVEPAYDGMILELAP